MQDAGVLLILMAIIPTAGIPKTLPPPETAPTTTEPLQIEPLQITQLQTTLPSWQGIIRNPKIIRHEQEPAPTRTAPEAKVTPHQEPTTIRQVQPITAVEELQAVAHTEADRTAALVAVAADRLEEEEEDNPLFLF